MPRNVMATRAARQIERRDRSLNACLPPLEVVRLPNANVAFGFQVRNFSADTRLDVSRFFECSPTSADHFGHHRLLVDTDHFFLEDHPD